MTLDLLITELSLSLSLSFEPVSFCLSLSKISQIFFTQYLGNAGLQEGKNVQHLQNRVNIDS